MQHKFVHALRAEDMVLLVSGVIEHRIIAEFSKNVFLVIVIHRRDDQQEKGVEHHEEGDEKGE